MAKINTLFRFLFILFFSLFCISSVAAQAKALTQPENALPAALYILPLVAFVLATATGILNLWMMARLGKNKEDILNIVKAEIHSVEATLASKEGLEAMKIEMALRFDNIKLIIENEIAKALAGPKRSVRKKPA